MNEFLWGDEPSSKQLELLNKFDTNDKVKAAFRSCQVRNLQMLPRYLTRHTGSEYEPTNWRLGLYCSGRTARAGAHCNYIAVAVGMFADSNPAWSIEIHCCRMKSGACYAAMRHKSVLSLIIRKMVASLAV
jgi:hypothetical protein